MCFVAENSDCKKGLAKRRREKNTKTFTFYATVRNLRCDIKIIFE